jgi:perosamine synthetase
MRYPIYEPDVTRYTSSIQSALQSGWISSQGEFLDKARDEAVRVLGSPYCVLVNNGTSATHLLYKALKFRHPTLTTLYVPNSVFVAVWNCALYEYPASALRVLEMDPATLNMREDEAYLDSLEQGAAVVIVHNVGTVVNVPRLRRLRPDLIFVEDCCEAFLERYEGQITGTASLCGAVSFFANKLVTTGEGGLWYTSDPELYAFILKSCHHGMTSERYVYDVLGYNYRMTNLQAAFLYDQLRDSDRIVETKRRVRDRYASLLREALVSPGLWMTVVRSPGLSFAELSPLLRTYGIDSRPMFYPLQTHAHLRAISAGPCAIEQDTLLMLPSSPGLTLYDQVYIATIFRALATGTRPPQVHRIDASTRGLLDAFVANDLPPTFRYFRTRTVETCLQDHDLTLVCTENDVPVGYAHLEDRWIGVCVRPAFQGRAMGSFLLDMVLAYAHGLGLPSVRLTVDSDNTIARGLYERRGFRLQEVTGTVCRMEKSL